MRSTDTVRDTNVNFGSENINPFKPPTSNNLSLGDEYNEANVFYATVEPSSIRVN